MKTVDPWLIALTMPDMTAIVCCRLCDSTGLELALELPPSPIGDAFVPPSERDVVQPAYPLNLMLCRDCGHVQLGHTLDPEELFRNYLFETRTSLGLVEHFRKYCAEVLQKYPASQGELVVELGSNDGSLLKFFQEAGLRVLGVDPARRPAETARASGVPTLTDFFTSSLARQIALEHGQAMFVTANNVFAHAEGLYDMAVGVAELLSPRGLFIFEVSYLLDIVDKLLFDTIYHEHLSYHSIKPLAQFLARAGLELIDVERIKTKGGSIRCFAQRRGGPYPVASSVGQLIEIERETELDQVAPFRGMQARIGQLREEVTARLMPYLSSGKEVAGYGASPTATTLMYSLGLEDRLSYLVDDNPLKHGLLSPGCHLPVHRSSELVDRKPAMTVVLAWNYADPILRRNEAYVSQGGQFLVPLPNVRVVG